MNRCVQAGSLLKPIFDSGGGGGGGKVGEGVEGGIQSYGRAWMNDYIPSCYFRWMQLPIHATTLMLVWSNLSKNGQVLLLGDQKLVEI